MTDLVITPQRYAQGMTYEAFLAQVSGNRENFQANEAAFKLAPEDAAFFRDIVRKLGEVKVLALTEEWCPDAHRGLPVVAVIAGAAGMELRVFYRDKNQDIMNLYLNQGKYQSIPVFAFFDKDLKPLGHFIERPAAATRFMEATTAELGKLNLGKDELRQEARRRYAPLAEGWRQETVREIKELLGRAAGQG